MPTQSDGRINVPLKDGTAIIASDAHYWPSKPSTAHRAFVAFAEELQPDVIIFNGDVIDAATISRHPPIGWDSHPSVKEELDVAQERLQEVEAASSRSRLIWTLGNHDARFETRLASVASEYKGVYGVHLKDHFPQWEPAWSVDLGGNKGAMIKHRWKGGQHAAYNNTVASGRSILTGHLHRLAVIPFTDYTGTRFGVEGGMLSEVRGPQFLGYTEDNPLNWQSGFVILTFREGRLMMPETVRVVKPGVVEWRGEEYNV